MPRKKLLYTHEYPYHVMARSNNKENFYIEKDIMWEIVISSLNQVVTDLKVYIHAFVLMDNHYHLLLSTHPNYDLGVVMHRLQRSISRKVNSESGRINHVFGGAYKASLIQTPEYYYNVYKYLYRNPIEAGLCETVNDYKYSTFTTDVIPICSPISGIASFVPLKNKSDWIDETEDELWSTSISKGLKKTLFKPVYPR